MVNIKNFRLFLIKESSEMGDALETVFAELSDKYITSIDIPDRSKYAIGHSYSPILATISFTLDNHDTKHFNTGEFLDRVKQLKDYLGNDYIISYSYKTMAISVDHIPVLPTNREVTSLKIAILEKFS